MNLLQGWIKTVTIRNKVAEISNKLEKCNITVRSSEVELKLALSGLKNPVQSLASGDIEVEGERLSFFSFYLASSNCLPSEFIKILRVSPSLRIVP